MSILNDPIIDPIEQLLTPGELATLRRSMSDDEAYAWQIRRAYVAKVAKRRNIRFSRGRSDGMRVRLSAIEGMTKGDAKKVLAAPYYFQCPPMDSVAKPRSRTWNKRVNYIGDEYSERGGMPLRPFTFRTLAVEWGSFVVEDFWDVDWLVEALERISDSGYPVHLLATTHYGESAFVDMVVALESVTPTLQSGENDAVYLDLTFSQYRDPVLGRRASSKHYPETVILEKDGDWTFEGTKHFKKPLTFRLLAELAYGKPSLARHIMKAQKPPINDWGQGTPVIRHHRFKNKGGKITVPAPPKDKTPTKHKKTATKSVKSVKGA